MKITITKIQISLSLNLSESSNKIPNPKQPSLTDSGLLFRQKILYLEHNLNINSRKALTLNPSLRSTPLSAVKSVADCLSSMGLHRSQASKVLDMHPTLLTADPHSDLYPILDFLLHDANLSFPEAARALIRCPRILLCDVDAHLRPNLHFLKTLGFSAVTPLTALLLVSSVENTLRPKLDFLRRRLGISEADVAAMVVRSPSLLTYSLERNLSPKVEFFLGEMRGEVGELLRFPQYFSFSLDMRIRPRFRAIQEIGCAVSLPEMLKLRDIEFGDMLMEFKLRRIE